jgi:hypothetical protein
MLSEDTTRVALEPWAWGHVASQELASQGGGAGCDHEHRATWLHGSRGTTMGVEPCGSMGARVAVHELASWGGGAKEATTCLSHMAARLPASLLSGRWSQGGHHKPEPRGGTGARISGRRS